MFNTILLVWYVQVTYVGYNDLPSSTQEDKSGPIVLRPSIKTVSAAIRYQLHETRKMNPDLLF